MFERFSRGIPGATGAECGAPGFSHALDQHFVKHAVVSTGKQHNLIAASNSARHAQRGHYRFRPSVTEAHSLVAGHLAEELRYLARQRRLRADFEALMKLLSNRLLNEVRTMAQHDRAKPVQDVDVLVAIDVP